MSTRHLGEERKGSVVVDLPIAQHTAVTVIRVATQAHVCGHDERIAKAIFEGTDRVRHQPIRFGRSEAYGVLALFFGDPEEEDLCNAELEVLLVGAWIATRAAVFDLRGDLVRELDLIGLAGRAAARLAASRARSPGAPGRAAPTRGVRWRCRTDGSELGSQKL